MKTRFYAVLLAALAVFVFSGCTVHALQQLEQAEEVIDHHMDKAEGAIENHIESSIADNAAPKSQAPASAPTQPSAAETGKITKEEAVSIALNHAKLEESQVSRLRVEFDYDDGRPEYEVDFYHDGWEYDYEIHAETGKITGWDKDLND